MNLKITTNDNGNLDLLINLFKVEMDYLYTHNIIVAHKKEDKPIFEIQPNIETYTLYSDLKIDECLNFIQAFEHPNKLVIIDLNNIKAYKLQKILSTSAFHNTNVVLLCNLDCVVTDYVIIPNAEFLNDATYIGGLIAVKIGNTRGYLNSNEICIQN